MHIDPIGPYENSIIKNNPGGAIIKKYVSLTFMTIIDRNTGYFEIFKVPCFNLEEVARVNIEYIDKLSERSIQLSNHTWLFS